MKSVRPELNALFNNYLTVTGTRNQEMAANLLLAHVVLNVAEELKGVRDDLKRLEQIILAEPVPPTSD